MLSLMNKSIRKREPLPDSLVSGVEVETRLKADATGPCG